MSAKTINQSELEELIRNSWSWRSYGSDGVEIGQPSDSVEVTIENGILTVRYMYEASVENNILYLRKIDGTYSNDVEQEVSA